MDYSKMRHLDINREEIEHVINIVKKQFNLNIDPNKMDLMGTQVTRNYRSAIVTPTSFFEGDSYKAHEQLDFIRRYKRFLERFNIDFIIPYNIKLRHKKLDEIGLQDKIECNNVDLLTVGSILLYDIFTNDEASVDVQQYMIVKVMSQITNWIELINCKSFSGGGLDGRGW